MRASFAGPWCTSGRAGASSGTGPTGGPGGRRAAGPPGWIRLSLHTSSTGEAIAYICRLTPAAPPGEVLEYSDLGFILLGELVARCSGKALDAHVAARLAPCLGWERTRFRPPPEWHDQCVATEEGNAYERAAAGEEGAGYPWRTDVLVGEVHDGNCHYLFGGAAGRWARARRSAPSGTPDSRGPRC